MCAPQPRDLMVRYLGFSIRHTDFGIRNSRIGNRVKRFLRAAKDSILTRWMMVRQVGFL